MDYGKILKEQREKAGMTQSEFARKVGVSRRAVWLWETGQRVMSINNADKAFTALETAITIGCKIEAVGA